MHPAAAHAAAHAALAAAAAAAAATLAAAAASILAAAALTASTALTRAARCPTSLAACTAAALAAPFRSADTLRLRRRRPVGSSRGGRGGAGRVSDGGRRLRRLHGVPRLRQPDGVQGSVL